jgi:outer membrane protein assembly factor BamB
MKNLFSALAMAMGLMALGSSAQAAPTFTMDTKFLTPPDGMATIGDSHGDIAISPAGEIYVSVQGGDHAGIQVYSAKGKYLRNVPGAPTDLHGFIIARAPDGTPSIFGVSRLAQHIVAFRLDGRTELDIPASVIPEQYKEHAAGKPATNLTGIAVAPNGDIYVTDGYGLDFIHRFDKTGKYIASFGGKGPPWNFDTCHKLAIDTRFTPVRLLCTDRKHNRLVHMDLDGHVLGVFAEGLRLPSALSVYGDELAVAELAGRVTILDKKGQVITSIGANDNDAEIRTNKAPPSIWQPDRFYAPHGIVYDKQGNLLVTEFNQFGRVTRLVRQ